MSEKIPQEAPGNLLPRRGFLKVGLLGTAAVAVGGVGLALRGSLLREGPAAGLKCLTLREYSILAAVGDAILPAAGEGAPSASEIEVARVADDVLSQVPEEDQKQIKLLLGIFDNALVSFLFDGRMTPFTKLSVEDQQKALLAWGNSRVQFRRTAFQALKGLVGAFYYGDQRTWKRIGYGGPPDVSAYRIMRAAEREAEQGGLRAQRKLP